MKNIIIFLVMLFALSISAQDIKVRSVRYQEVTEAEMNAIPLNKLSQGSTVFRSDTKTDWKYIDGSWSEVTGGSVLNFDAIPTDGSNNAVSSNGVFDALSNKLDNGGLSTINGQSIEGGGDITISGGTSDYNDLINKPVNIDEDSTDDALTEPTPTAPRIIFAYGTESELDALPPVPNGFERIEIDNSTDTFGSPVSSDALVQGDNILNENTNIDLNDNSLVIGSGPFNVSGPTRLFLNETFFRITSGINLSDRTFLEVQNGRVITDLTDSQIDAEGDQSLITKGYADNNYGSSTGTQGLQGIQGEKGDTGDTGPQGIQGTPGSDGTGLSSSLTTFTMSISDPDYTFVSQNNSFYEVGEVVFFSVDVIMNENGGGNSFSFNLNGSSLPDSNGHLNIYNTDVTGVEDGSGNMNANISDIKMHQTSQTVFRMYQYFSGRLQTFNSSSDELSNIEDAPGQGGIRIRFSGSYLKQ